MNKDSCPYDGLCCDGGHICVVYDIASDGLLRCCKRYVEGFRGG